MVLEKLDSHARKNELDLYLSPNDITDCVTELICRCQFRVDQSSQFWEGKTLDGEGTGKDFWEGLQWLRKRSLNTHGIKTLLHSEGDD